MSTADEREQYKQRVIASVEIDAIESGEQVMYSMPCGYLTADALRIIADHLDILNAPLYALWEEQFEWDAQFDKEREIGEA